MPPYPSSKNTDSVCLPVCDTNKKILTRGVPRVIADTVILVIWNRSAYQQSRTNKKFELAEFITIYEKVKSLKKSRNDSNVCLGILNPEDQALCLDLGQTVNIDIKAIIVAAVVSVRSGQNVQNVSHFVGWEMWG